MVSGILFMGTVTTAYSDENCYEKTDKLKCANLIKPAEYAQTALEKLEGGRTDEAILDLKNARMSIHEYDPTHSVYELQKALKGIKETLLILFEEHDNKKAIEVFTPIALCLIHNSNYIKNEIFEIELSEKEAKISERESKLEKDKNELERKIADFKRTR